MIEHQLRQFALERYQSFTEAPVQGLFRPNQAFITPSPRLVQYVMTNKKTILSWLESQVQTSSPSDFSNYFATQTEQYFFRKNQFLDVSREHKQTLRDLYQDNLRDFYKVVQSSQSSDTLTQALRSWLTDHQHHLATFVQTLATDQVSPTFVFKEPVNAEYSAAFQLSLLGLTPETLQEPILDLGCGSQALLVRHLRQLGYEAIGLDRHASDMPFVRQQFWPNLNLATQQWGTIISHMAFSTHFLHHHLSPKGQVHAYAQCYMHLLHALKPGARLIYAPGLPFIEEHLPPQAYKIQRNPIQIPASLPATTIPQYSCIITKRV